jgi:PAS domain S-box-containing protein
MVLTDVIGTVRAANPAYCARHGSTPQLLIGKSLAMTFPEAERASAMARYREVFASRGNPDAFPAVSQWRDDPEQVTESRIAFATQQDGQSFMMSSVRTINERPGEEPGALALKNDPADRDAVRDSSQAGPAAGEFPSLASNEARTAAELVVDAVRDWGIEVVFGLPGDPPPSLVGLDAVPQPRPLGTDGSGHPPGTQAEAQTGSGRKIEWIRRRWHRHSE